MFYRVLAIFAILAVALKESAATNLRANVVESQRDLDIPIDHARAERAAKGLISSAGKAAKKDHDANTAFVKKLNDEKLKMTKEEHEAKAISSKKVNEQLPDIDEIVRWGSFVTRHRPNSDCSGTPSMVSASKVMGECFMGAGSSWYYACAHEDENGNVNVYDVNFNSNDCTGPIWFFYESYQSGRKCQMDTFNDGSNNGYSLPEMKSLQCSRKSHHDIVQGGGLSQYFYSDPTCSGESQAALHMPFNACELSTYEHNGETSFEFVSVTDCTMNDKFSVTGYSDRACTRPIWRGQARLDGHQLNECFYENDYTNGMGGYARYTCQPANPMP